jgi:hypothetical protein
LGYVFDDGFWEVMNELKHCAGYFPVVCLIYFIRPLLQQKAISTHTLNVINLLLELENLLPFISDEKEKVVFSLERRKI